MIIDCISDLHGFYPELDGGDLLIVAGDLTARDSQRELDIFDEWLANQPYKKKIFIAGNHDNILILEKPQIYKLRIGQKSFERCEYLCDSGTEFEGLKIWGSPWTKTFKGMNPNYKAFTVDTEKELAEKWGKIPNDVDILITHCPPFGILDGIKNEYVGTFFHAGSISLKSFSVDLNPCVHVFGHIHECGGQKLETITTAYVNASIMDEVYDPVHKPVRVIL